MTSPIIMMGDNIENINDVPAGNTCAIVGIENYIQKTGTISDHPDAHCIKSMKYSVSPVVSVAINVDDPQDLPKLYQGLKKLQNFDNLVQCTIDENTGQYIISGSGELHVEVCIKILEEQLVKKKIR